MKSATQAERVAAMLAAHGVGAIVDPNDDRDEVVGTLDDGRSFCVQAGDASAAQAWVGSGSGTTDLVTVRVDPGYGRLERLMDAFAAALRQRADRGGSIPQHSARAVQFGALLVVVAVDVDEDTDLGVEPRGTLLATFDRTTEEVTIDRRVGARWVPAVRARWEGALVDVEDAAGADPDASLPDGAYEEVEWALAAVLTADAAVDPAK